MRNIDREGIFRVIPTNWDILRANSGAVGITVDFQILEQWDESAQKWSSWKDYDDYGASGTWWVIKIDKSLNNMAIEQLAVIGWNGSFPTILNEEPPEIRCQVTVANDSYKGKDRLRADWIKPYTSDPHGFEGSIAENDLNSLETQFGSLVRAAIGTPVSKPASRPSKSPKPKESPAAKQPTSEPVQQPSEPSAGEVAALTKQKANQKLKELIELNASTDEKKKLLKMAKDAGLDWDEEKEEFSDGLPF